MPELDRVQVPPERLERWLSGFATRHPDPRVTVTDGVVLLSSPDGAQARIEPPWGEVGGADPLADLVGQVTRRRRLGVLLVRRNAHAVGVFDGPELIRHRVGRHYVQGKTKAGGWSQQRYARRRGHQAERAFAKATHDAAELLLPVASELEAILLGGDAQAVRTVLGDPALAALTPLTQRHRTRLLGVADPNLQVLRDSLPRFLAVSIGLNAEARGLPAAQRDDQPGQH
ncbi:MAG: acVLRF1 family peptidyl-tRNA hydrolase [Micropruina sp.]|uniref:acVLRF1 family peptidyl-tRNA hydrolase n=1 Tax=Micropruina sp. TaxID=2737536 RepID=UPI0039E6E838